jgi:hypothetical protein
VLEIYFDCCFVADDVLARNAASSMLTVHHALIAAHHAGNLHLLHSIKMQITVGIIALIRRGFLFIFVQIVSDEP